MHFDAVVHSLTTQLIEQMRDVLQSRRILMIDGDISKEQLDRLRETIISMMVAAPGEKIYLIINSPGGNAEPSLWFYDFLKLVQAPVIGLVNGECSSSALIILQGCQRRLSTPNSWFLTHPTISNYTVPIADKQS